jgi:hypothetical protein
VAVRGGLLGGLAILWVAAAPAVASAQVEPPPPVSLYYENLVGGRVNPLGLVDFARFSLRLRLHESDAAILAQNYVGIGVAPALSPAWGRLGALVEVQPLSILRLYAQYDFLGYFSTFNLFASFPSASSDYSDTTIRDRTALPGLGSYATYGGMLTLGATLQMKLGPVAARSLFRAVHTSYDMRRGDRVFYDQIFDMLMPNDGWLVTNDLDLLAVFDVEQYGFAVGARWTYSHAFYDERHRQPGEDPAELPNNDIHRLGPLVAWTLERNPGTRFDRPTLILIAQWHLVHRWRTGADVTVALPYLALAFKFQGDLLADR